MMPLLENPHTVFLTLLLSKSYRQMANFEPYTNYIMTNFI